MRTPLPRLILSPVFYILCVCISIRALVFTCFLPGLFSSPATMAYRPLMESRISMTAVVEAKLHKGTHRWV